MFKLSIIGFFLFFILNTAFCQQLKKCDNEKNYWLIQKDSISYSLKLKGKVETTENKNIITVNNFVLQYLIIDKNKYRAQGEDGNEFNILIRYAMSEIEYLSKKYDTKLNLQMQKAPLSQDNFVLVWYYEMPSSLNQQVKFQLYANLIIGDKIFGVASPQFSDQKIEDVKDFLMDVISTLKIENNINRIDE